MSSDAIGGGRVSKVRRNESMGFVDAVMADLGGPRSAALLEKLDAATPWETLAAPIRALPEYNNPGAGHPPWCPVLMLKCLMLAKWNNLSDPGLEESLKDCIIPIPSEFRARSARVGVAPRLTICDNAIGKEASLADCRA